MHLANFAAEINARSALNVGQLWRNAGYLADQVSCGILATRTAGSDPPAVVGRLLYTGDDGD